MQPSFTVSMIAIAVVGFLTSAESIQSARDVAMDIYHTCLKDLETNCAKSKAMQWLRNALHADEIILTEQLSIMRTGPIPTEMQTESRSISDQEKLFNNIDNFLSTHALRLRSLDFLASSEARAFIPQFLLNNVLAKGGLVPLTDIQEDKGRGFMRKAVLPFLIGLKLKTLVLVPLALVAIAVKTWKAMTLGLLSLVLSGALIVFKIAKPKIINYEVVHYPHRHHVQHFEHTPHHIEHIVPHHVDHHIEQHLDIPHHVDHIEHATPSWDPHSWRRSSQEMHDNMAQDMAYAAQRKR